MPESIVQVTEGAGKKLHTWQRTVGANAVEDEFTLPGEYPLPSYIATAYGTSIATAASHIFQIMAGASTYVRIRRITIEQQANATAAGKAQFELLRLTTAGTGGTAITPRPLDTSDAASDATCMTLPTAKGTEGVILMERGLVLRQAFLATATQADAVWEWQAQAAGKSIIIPAGTTNGIAIKAVGASAGATVTWSVEWVETTFAG